MTQHAIPIIAHVPPLLIVPITVAHLRALHLHRQAPHPQAIIIARRQHVAVVVAIIQRV